jgi:hypothetical protein
MVASTTMRTADRSPDSPGEPFLPGLGPKEIEWATLPLPEGRVGALAIYQSQLWTVGFCRDSFRTWIGNGAFFDTPAFERTPLFEGFRPTEGRRVLGDQKGEMLINLHSDRTMVIVPERCALHCTVTDPKTGDAESREIGSDDSLCIMIRGGLRLQVRTLGEQAAVRVYE